MKGDTYTSAYLGPRAAASRRSFRHRQCPLLADQRPIGCSKAVFPLEIAEFNGVGLAGDRERVKATYSVEKLDTRAPLPGADRAI
jgi:hypothetical protein